MGYIQAPLVNVYNLVRTFSLYLMIDSLYAWLHESMVASITMTSLPTPASASKNTTDASDSLGASSSYPHGLFSNYPLVSLELLEEWLSDQGVFTADGLQVCEMDEGDHVREKGLRVVTRCDMGEGELSEFLVLLSDCVPLLASSSSF